MTQKEDQKRLIERKNVKNIIQQRDQEARALKAENESYRQQLLQLGLLQEPCVSLYTVSALHVSLQYLHTSGRTLSVTQKGIRW